MAGLGSFTGARASLWGSSIWGGRRRWAAAPLARRRALLVAAALAALGGGETCFVSGGAAALAALKILDGSLMPFCSNCLDACMRANKV